MHINSKKGILFNILDKLSSFSLYFIAVSIPLGVAPTEISVFFAISIFIIKKVLKKEPLFSDSWVDKAVILFILWNIVTIFRSEYLRQSLQGVMKVVKFGFLFFAVTDALKDAKVFKNLIKVALFIGAIISLDGLLQYIIGCDLIRFSCVDFFDNPRRISAAFHHPNDFGGYLVMIIPIFLSIWFSKYSSLKIKIAMVPALGLALVALFLTRSNGAWLGFYVSIMMLGLFKGKKMFIVFLIVFVFLPLITVPQISNRIRSKFTEERNTAWERLKLWEGTVNMIKASPFMGLGVNTYSKNFPKYKPADYPDIRYAHNSFLQMASEIGLVGLGIFIFIVISVLLGAFKSLKRLAFGWPKEAYIGFLCALFGFLIHSGVDTHLYALVLATLFWFSLAIISKGKDVLVLNDNAAV